MRTSSPLPWTLGICRHFSDSVSSTHSGGSLVIITWGGSLRVHPSGKCVPFTCVVTLEEWVVGGGVALKPGYWMSRG